MLFDKVIDCIVDYTLSKYAFQRVLYIVSYNISFYRALARSENGGARSSVAGTICTPWLI